MTRAFLGRCADVKHFGAEPGSRFILRVHDRTRRPRLHSHIQPPWLPETLSWTARLPRRAARTCARRLLVFSSRGPGTCTAKAWDYEQPVLCMRRVGSLIEVSR